MRLLADLSGTAQTRCMLKSVIRSPWLSVGAAALFALLGLAFETERVWLLGMAGTAAFYGFFDLIGIFFKSQDDR